MIDKFPVCPCFLILVLKAETSYSTWFYILEEIQAETFLIINQLCFEFFYLFYHKETYGKFSELH